MRNREVKLDSIWDIVHRKMPGSWKIYIRRFHAQVVRDQTLAVVSIITYPVNDKKDVRDAIIRTWSQGGELWVK